MSMRWKRHDGDDGITLVVAIMVMGVAMALVATVIGVAITTGNQSGRDRQRTAAVNAAEAAVDASYATIQSSGLNLPCQWPAGGTPVNAGTTPDTVTSVSSIEYFAADGSPMPCTGGVLVTSSTSYPAQARIVGDGETNQLPGGTTNLRKIEALVNVTPVYGDSLNKAIFADGGLTFTNQTTLTGSSGPDADVYSNESFTCANNQNFAGSVYSQGTITVQGSCTVAGDLWAKTGVSNSAGANGTVGGRVLTAANDVNLPGNFKINGTVLAGGSINWGGCAASAGKCVSGTTVAAPPQLPFPILNSDAATLQKWVDVGYSIVPHSNCATVKNAIKNTYAKYSGKTLVLTDCRVSFANDKNIALYGDLAIFADGGFSSSQQVSFVSNNGSPRILHWIVPADTTASPCGITTDNQFNFATEVNMLVYSPCDISFSNNADHLGQVIGGGDVTINNQFAMQYREVPVWGIDPTSLPLLSYKIDIVHKREIR
ncbi:MAG: hypothetical protein ACOYXW_11545 [Actinomycetota bacterium]